MKDRIKELLAFNHFKAFILLQHFKGAQLLEKESVPIDFVDGTRMTTEFCQNEWEIHMDVKEVPQRENTLDVHVVFRLLKGAAEQLCVGVGLQFDNWSRDNYVLMPAAAYNGNRFESRDCPYPPILQNEKDLRVDVPTLISDIPRLNIHDGPSRIQLLTGDFSTPAVGFYAPHTQQGFWMMTKQETSLGNTGIALEENEARNSAWLELTAPGMRRNVRYTICNNQLPCEDQAANFKEGDSVEMHFRICFFKCLDLQELFNRFAVIRKDLSGPVSLKHEIPFSSAWEIQEEKYNRENWEDHLGYYSVGSRETLYQDWQVGWVGGLMVTHPLLLEGTMTSKERAVRNFDFLFNGGQDRSGFFHGCGHQGKWYGDNFRDTKKKWHLIRKSGDAFYFIIKQFMLIEKLNLSTPGSIPLKKEWLDKAQLCGNAFVKLWKKYGQFGQFVDTQTGDIIIGNSSCGGIVPAGLALAGQYFGRDDYRKVAEEAAIYYYTHFTEKGLSTGGPGEILQCPDSESAFAMLESFTVLYEVTGEKHWLEKASAMAYQCMTWCVSYDFRFPEKSTFGKLDMRTSGAVSANVQNKPSSPGICTLSGDSLFKLYRYTGNRLFLELIQEIAHAIPQFMSRKDRPICALDKRIMPEGWINERVEISDWLEPLGEIFYGSCWCEVSNMMTYAEIPGLYVQTDTGLVCAIDHIDAEIREADSGNLVVRVTNPTRFPAEVKVFVEKSTDMDRILGQNAMLHCKRIRVESGKHVDLSFERTSGTEHKE